MPGMGGMNGAIPGGAYPAGGGGLPGLGGAPTNLPPAGVPGNGVPLPGQQTMPGL